MTGLDIFTFVVMFVLLTAVAVLIKILGALPGKLARNRAHPQADAINICGWLGIVTLGIAWPVALVLGLHSPDHRGQRITPGGWKHEVGRVAETDNRRTVTTAHSC